MIGWPGRYSYNYYPDGSQREVRDGMGVLLRTYSYTPAGLLGRVDYPGQISPAFHYWDGDGNRVRYLPRDLPDIYTFVYDPTAGIPAVVEEINEDSGTTTLYYREPDGSLVARARYGVYQFYHFDALGSTRILTDGSGNVTDRYSYDAWGNVTPDPNNQTPDNPYQYVGQLGYYTHYQEPEFGLLQLGVRFYDPEVGRFAQRDMLASGQDVYSYADNGPLLWTDPSGYRPVIMGSYTRMTLSGCFPVFSYQTHKTRSQNMDTHPGWTLVNASEESTGAPRPGIPFVFHITCFWERTRLIHRVYTETTYIRTFYICVEPCGRVSSYTSSVASGTRTWEKKRWKLEGRTTQVLGQTAWGYTDPWEACWKSGGPRR